MARYPRVVHAVPEVDPWTANEPVAGDCFDWLDHDTRELVLQAIDLNDTDDIAEFCEAAESKAPVKRITKRGRIKCAAAASVHNRAKRANKILGLD